MIDSIYNIYVSTIVKYNDAELITNLPVVIDTLEQLTTTVFINTNVESHKILINKLNDGIASNNTTAYQLACISILHVIVSHCSYNTYHTHYINWYHSLMKLCKIYSNTSQSISICVLQCVYNVMQYGCMWPDVRRDIYSGMVHKYISELINVVHIVNNQTISAKRNDQLIQLLTIMFGCIASFQSSIRGSIPSIDELCYKLIVSGNNFIQQVCTTRLIYIQYMNMYYIMMSTLMRVI